MKREVSARWVAKAQAIWAVGAAKFRNVLSHDEI